MCLCLRKTTVLFTVLENDENKILPKTERRHFQRVFRHCELLFLFIHMLDPLPIGGCVDEHKYEEDR